LRLLISADPRVARAAATARSISHELLHAAGGINFAAVNVAFRIDAHDVRPVELANLTASGPEAIQFLQILAVDLVDRVVGQVGHVRATLLRIGRKVQSAGRAGRRLWRDVHLADETALTGFA